MPPIDETTTNRAYPKPNVANTLAYDVAKLRTALDSIDSDTTGLFNNMAQPHSTRTAFDATSPSYGFGYRYVQGSTNGPGSGGTQFYSGYLGLGSDYPATGAGSYGMYFAIDRNVTNPYLSIRYNEANSLSTWRKISAGKADSWTTGRTISLTGDVTYTSGSLDGTANVTGAATLANSGVTAGSYTTANITVDAKGRITAASSGTSGVTSFSAGTTGLTPSTATTGAVTLAGTLAVANGGTGVTTSTGSGSVVLSTSPSLTTPVLGTPTSGTLTNCTGYTFANIASKPTTLSGYGITDAATSTGTGASGTWAINTNGFLSDASYRSIVNPGGGQFVTSSSVLTGAIAVTLPVGMTNTMVRMTIKVYEYTTNESFEIICGGYNYSVSNTWANNPFAYIVGNPDIDRRFNVRFGYTAGGRAIVYIGELASTWSYPQIFITEVQCGYSGTSATWATGWSIAFQSTAFENVTATISNCQIGFRSSTNTANSVALRDASGNFSAGTITAALSGNATTATTLLTARSIGGVSFNGSADITPFRANTVSTIDAGTIMPSAVVAYGSRTTSSGPNNYAYGINWEFKNSSTFSVSGNYSGLLTLAPWLGTTASTGDPSYQLLFSPSAVNSTASPELRFRAGIDSTWGSWATVLNSTNIGNFAVPLSSFNVKAPVDYATTADLGAATYSAGVLSNYPYNTTVQASTTAGSSVVALPVSDTSTLKAGATVNVASIYVPAGLTIATIDSTTQVTLNAAVRTLSIFSITGNGTSAVISHTTTTYATFAIGSIVTITGSTGAAYDGTWTVVGSSTNSTTITNSNTTGQAASGGTISQTITTGSDTALGFRNVLASLSVDGFSPASGTRILVKDQRTLGGLADSTGVAKNGIYTVTNNGASNSPWVLTRAVDFDSASDAALAQVYVKSGASNKARIFTTSFLSTDTFDTSPVYWRTGLTRESASVFSLAPAIGLDIDIQPRTILNTGAGIATLYANYIGTTSIIGTTAATHTNAATLRIDGSPSAGANTTFTNKWALSVGGGTDSSYLGGGVAVGYSPTTAVTIERGPITTLGTFTTGSGYVDTTYSNVALAGGRGSYARATIVVLGGVVSSVTLTAEGLSYAVNDTLTYSTLAGFSVPVAAIRVAQVTIGNAISGLRLHSTNTSSTSGVETAFIDFTRGNTTYGGHSFRCYTQTVTGVGGSEFYITDGSSAGEVQKLRISNSGQYYIPSTLFASGATSASTSVACGSFGQITTITTAGTPLYLSRLGSDGILQYFYRDGGIVGYFTVSAGAVTLIGGHLSRETQLQQEPTSDLLMGTVLSNVDEMCDKGTGQINIQLNKMIVSNVERDENVSGVFQAYAEHEEENYMPGSLECAMTGDYVIRIGRNTIVKRGDLLTSAGDGTAMPQGDNIVRSYTIAKVTSAVRTIEHEDGSYCVPCILMV